MSITVGDELMTGDITQHNAGRWRDETGEVWVVSWLPMRQYLLSHIQSAALVEGCDGKVTLKD